MEQKKQPSKVDKTMKDISEARNPLERDRLAGLEYLISEISRDVNLLESELDNIYRKEKTRNKAKDRDPKGKSLDR